jgi:radical SAM superfamily enzyme YgiQ (UPF0313 family)
VDLVVRGEGEFTFLELVMGKKFSSIEGLSYKDNGKNNPLIHSAPFSKT